ncbi:RHS repeat-associated core domain-containing protein [Pseudomonas syringae]|uniref:RHS repeat-associated core domain-containing protein n=1 Tax=Pseudomonas syringae group TaxID=136849 RepID=UPI000BBD61C7|nr:RHS repeat-associated core domain-containing protein [Pseudomonas viridiflava]MCQ9391468.1 RHS repeat-associated core domain-containing protein [Pseudomonas viridiflava]MEE4086371.1 RHS repeat-associated core domain-containing protein [Pseudomonas viridiflava]PCK89778.1 hypothetical protein PsyrCH409_22415 [Pseudomonas viridiflava]WKW33567.1 RHS repeat-associated core domain-containing protein [Pseudomonas viridiflava]
MKYCTGLLYRYRYDPLDRLASSGLSTQTRIQRFYQNDRLTTELQGNVQRSILQYEQQLLAEQRHDNGHLAMYALATNVQRSVLAAQGKSHQDNAVYTPYGHTALRESPFSILGFSGERPDPETGHYALGNGRRVFNPVLMRFHSPDSPSPFAEGGLNAYAYCSGDPVNRSDPDGRSWQFLATALDRLSTSSAGPLTLGTISKPITNFRSIAIGIDTFEDTYKGKLRLNIMAHGGVAREPIDQGGRSFSYIVSDAKPLNSDRLLALLYEHDVRLGRYRNIRLLSCALADAELSFLAKLSGITGKPVKGFSGQVSAFEHPRRKNVPIGSIDESVKKIVIHKNRGLMGKIFRPYTPKTFLPTDNIRHSS